MPKKKTGIIFVAVGVMLTASALLLMFYNEAEDREALKAAEEALGAVMEVIDEVKEEVIPDPVMPVVEIDGYGYIGYLDIEKIDLSLPVMNVWSYTRLKKAPCRHFGSSRTDDLVIAAHNYKAFFRRLKELEKGDEVVFTDMDGIVVRYEVIKKETISPEDVEAVQKSGHDLVLYTCTPGAGSRVAVFCDRTEETGDE